MLSALIKIFKSKGLNQKAREECILKFRLAPCLIAVSTEYQTRYVFKHLNRIKLKV